MDNLLELSGVFLERDGRDILKDINLKIDDGEIVTILGPNGAGKTTLLKVMTRLLTPHKGQVHHRTNLRLAYVPQKFRMPDTVPMRVSDFLISNTDLSLQQAILKLSELEFNMGFDMEQPSQSLSGGQNQRLLLARALLSSPELLILDEPAQGFDYSLQARFYNTLREVRAKQQCSIVLVSHDLNLVMSTTDRVLCLNQHICCHGTTEDISKSPEYLDLFGLSDDADQFAVYRHEHDHEHAEDGSIISTHKHGHHHE